MHISTSVSCDACFFISDEIKEPEEKPPFSEPWEDSDLILVVEKEKFHVHRQILSIHSPVFKAMLNSQFKEATATEIPLPGKKAFEVSDFLKQLYLQDREGVTCEYENRVHSFRRVLCAFLELFWTCFSARKDAKSTDL